MGRRRAAWAYQAVAGAAFSLPARSVMASAATAATASVVNTISPPTPASRNGMPETNLFLFMVLSIDK